MSDEKSNRPGPMGKETNAFEEPEFYELHSQLLAANTKRSYDEYQDLGLTAARRSQVVFDQINNVALQALQNSVETSNMVAKRSLGHSELAVDRQWNIDPEAAQVIATAILAALGQAVVEEE